MSESDDQSVLPAALSDALLEAFCLRAFLGFLLDLTSKHWSEFDSSLEDSSCDERLEAWRAFLDLRLCLASSSLRSESDSSLLDSSNESAVEAFRAFLDLPLVAS